MTQQNAAKCPTCGSDRREIKLLVVHGELSYRCPDWWHRKPAAPPEGETNGSSSIRDSDNRVGDSMLSSRDGKQVEAVASQAMSTEGF